MTAETLRASRKVTYPQRRVNGDGLLAAGEAIEDRLKEGLVCLIARLIFKAQRHCCLCKLLKGLVQAAAKLLSGGPHLLFTHKQALVLTLQAQRLNQGVTKTGEQSDDRYMF